MPADAASGGSQGGMDRTARGAMFNPADLLTTARGSLSRPVFDASAGLFPAGGIRPAAMPDTLSGSYPVAPSVRELMSSSVMVPDTLSGGGEVEASPGDASAHPETLTHSSVYLSRSTGATGIRSLAALQAAEAAAKALMSARPSVETYAVGDAAGLTLPLKVNSTSYGFLNSSLTVFADDSGSFTSVGQSFNGLAALDTPEPASLAVFAAALAGLAAVRRRRRNPEAK